VTEPSDVIRLFAYGLFLRGEREHELLSGAEFVSEVKTAPKYTLVDLGVYPALLVGGNVAIVGELYAIDRKIRFSLDVKKEVPILFQRVQVELADGSHAEAYVIQGEQVRGKRRLSAGDWRRRFEPRARSDRAGPLVQAAKARFKPR